MNAEQWMELAINGRVSQVLIPMGFQPTLPELYLGADGWRILLLLLWHEPIWRNPSTGIASLPTGIFIGYQTCGYV